MQVPRYRYCIFLISKHFKPHSLQHHSSQHGCDTASEHHVMSSTRSGNYTHAASYSRRVCLCIIVCVIEAPHYSNGCVLCLAFVKEPCGTDQSVQGKISLTGHGHKLYVHSSTAANLISDKLHLLIFHGNAPNLDYVESASALVDF